MRRSAKRPWPLLLGLLLVGSADARQNYWVQVNQDPPGGEIFEQITSGTPPILGQVAEGDLLGFSVHDDSVSGSGYWRTLDGVSYEPLDRWKMRTRLRVVGAADPVDGAIMLEFFNFTESWRLQFGSDGDGDPIVQVPGVGAHVVEGGAGAFHDYEVVYSRAAQGAVLLVDGATVLGPFQATGAATESRFRFGSDDDAGTGHVEFDAIELVDEATGIHYSHYGETVPTDEGWSREGGLTGTSESPSSPPRPHSHSGDDSPTGTEGWSIAAEGGDLAHGPVSPDPYDGVTNAWFVRDNASDAKHAFSKTVSDQQIADGDAFGWKLQARVRVLSTGAPNVASIVEYVDGVNRYSMMFGAEADGDPIVELIGHGSYVLEGMGPGYHFYEIDYEPDDGLRFYVDGVEQLPGFTGEPLALKRVFWGSGGTGDTAHTYFADVSWDIDEPPGTVTKLHGYRITDASTAGGSTRSFSRVPSSWVKARADQSGWVMRANLRVNNTADGVDYSVWSEYADASVRWTIRWGSDAEGRPLVKVLGRPTVTVDDSFGGFHLYELAYDAAVGSAKLFVDGVERDSGIVPDSTTLNRIAWGSAQSSGTGSATWSVFEWELLACGDGDQDAAEQCDDGNLIDGDGCSRTCRIEPGYSCPREGASRDVATPDCFEVCGNGYITASEFCDDGNAIFNDGCNKVCQVELGWRCNGNPSECLEICGDYILTSSEQCDDGNTVALDRCSADCQKEYVLELYGRSRGGTVELTLGGQLIVVSTFPGEPPNDVVAGLVAAIQADAALLAAGISAGGDGAVLSANSPIENVTIDDDGLLQRHGDMLAQIEYVEQQVFLPGMSEVLQAVDFEDDGDLDIVTVEPGQSNSVLVLYLQCSKNDPSPDCDGQAPMSYLTYFIGFTPAEVRDISAADITGDGNRDILTATPFGAVIYEHLGGAQPVFGSGYEAWTGADQVRGRRAVRVADFDGDPAEEIFLLDDDAAVMVEYDSANHQFIQLCPNYLVLNDGGDASAAAFGRSPVDVRDVNRDGNYDVLYTLLGVPRIRYGLCDLEDVGLGSNWVEDALDDPQPICSFNGSFCDLVGAEHLPPNQQAYCAQYEGICELGFTIDTGGDDMSNTVRMADVDGNGLVDIVTRRCDENDVCELAWLKNYGRGTLQFSALNPPLEAVFSQFVEDTIDTQGLPIQNVTIADLDLDGSDEIILFGPDAGSDFSYFRYDIVERTFEQKMLPGGEPRFVVARDFEDDTDIDLVVWPKNNPFELKVFENKTVVEFDTDTLAISGDSDGEPTMLNGIPFSASIEDGIATFRVAGDLNIASTYRRVLRAKGGNALRLRVADDVILGSNVGFDVSARGLEAGPGGGEGEQASGSGGAGSPGGFGGAGGPGGDKSWGGIAVSVFPGFPGRGEGPATEGDVGAPGLRADDGTPGSAGDPGADGLHAPGSGGLAGQSNATPVNWTHFGQGGDGGYTTPYVLDLDPFCLDSYDGHTGGSGNPGATGPVGGTGGGGGGGLNTGFGLTLSAGGQGGAGAGGTGGTGGQGGGGGGGGGGGWGTWALADTIMSSGQIVHGCFNPCDDGALDCILDVVNTLLIPFDFIDFIVGGTGGQGGDGADGGPGGDGGIGGEGGLGGAGAGAIEIFANGRVLVDGDFRARGGDGTSGTFGTQGTPGLAGGRRDRGDRGTPGFQCCTGAVFEASFKTDPGGDGGDGGGGATGGWGGEGGPGGPGGGGAAGTVLLRGSIVDSRASVDVTGGSPGGPTGSPGGAGRFVIGAHNDGPFAGSLIGLDTPAVYPGSVTENPIAGGSSSTPYIPDLLGGAEGYGLLQTTAAAVAAEHPALAVPPAGAVAAVVRLDVGPIGYDFDISRHDMVLLLNIDGTPIVNPGFGLRGAPPYALPVRGVANDPEFGGGGAVPLATLDAGAVYGTMMPEGAVDAAIAFDTTGGRFEAVVGNLVLGQPAFLIPTAPSNSGELFGLARGGSVTVTIDGIEVTVVTGFEQTPESIVAALAAAIDADVVLDGMGVAAYADGARLVVSGSTLDIIVADAGLNDVGCPVLPQPTVLGIAVNTCPEVTAELATESFAAYQWFRNGKQIPGATESGYVATLGGDYSVRAQQADGCVGFSLDRPVSVSFCPETEVSPPGAIHAMALQPSTTPGMHWVTFQTVEGATGYHFYSGTFGNWSDHGAVTDDVCDAAFEDLGDGKGRIEVTLPDGDHYFLINGYDATAEGVSHTSSDGTAADPAEDICP